MQAQMLVRAIVTPEGAETFTQDVEDIYIDVDFSMTQAQINQVILDAIKDLVFDEYAVTMADSDIRYQPFVIPS